MPTLKMIVNNEPITLEVDALRPLVDVLREDLGLLGTKVGCREGECGACTILLDGKAVNSCLIPAMRAHGCSIVTIEGVGDVDNPHPVQVSITEEGGVQCGYCTPGFVMSAVGLLNKSPNPTEAEVREAISGNLCRCTGYNRIVKGILKSVEK
ncbi:MAG: (2Fe-2S)-binding protein [Chloroflexi bacterium]|nr:(2Fe-2S)-binding protein [Chloroflexota bacterium]